MTTYSNLPSKELDSLQKVVQYFDGYYSKPINLAVEEIDSLTGFFEAKGFEKSAAENISYVVLKTAKLSNYKPQEIIDALQGFNSIQLNEFLLSVLNFNRIKTSSLGIITKTTPSDNVNRNIRA